MEWLSNFFTQEPFSVAIPIAIIISVFVYAARRSHIKHIERVNKINEHYVHKVISK